jgi:hypothetical protein
VSAMNVKLTEKYPDYPSGIAPYRWLVLRDCDGAMTPEFVYAQRIDFCTGSGRARQDNKSFPTARLQPWQDPAKWKPVSKTRKILVAAEAVRSELTWDEGKRVCVANGGAIALNAAERARDKECWTDWFHNTDLMDAFGNPRNFTFIMHPSIEKARELGEGGKLTEAELIPAHQRIRLGRSAEVETAVEAGSGVDVSLKVGAPRQVPGAPPRVPKTPLIRDFKKNESALDTGAKRWLASDWYKGEFGSTGGGLPSVKYDRLIFHTGLVLAEVGQPYRTGCKDKLSPLTASGSRMVGLETADDAIRVLGAAAQGGYPQGLPAFDANNPGYAPSDKMWQFRQTLPVSAVPDGFILSGFNIADANHFFDYPNQNQNVNTMTSDQIKDALQDAGIYLDARDFAEAIVEARNTSNGYASAEDLETKLLIEANKKVEAINGETVEGRRDESLQKYMAKKKEIEETMKKITDPGILKTYNEILVLMHETEVSRGAALLMYGQEQLTREQKAEAKKAAELKQKLEDNKAKIGAAFKYSY